MKKTLSTLVCIFLLAVSAQAQNLYVSQTSGEETALPLSTITKITFASGNMIALTTSGEQTYALSAIKRLHFNDDVSVPSLLSTEPSFSYSPATHKLTLDGTAGSVVNVYSISGQRVLQAVQTLSGLTIDLSTLPRGIYVIESEGKSSKFVR